MFLVNPSSEYCNPIKVDALHHRRKRSEYLNCSGEGDNKDNDNNNKKMKMMHREVERQRRQEMATLYSTLRSLVPHEYLKVDALHHRRKRSEYLNCSGEGDKDNDNNNKKMKMMHREVERQRRQEMATLYSTLRSLVPHEYLKGKRSISDHMNEAANYVKHQQKKIKDLVKERDELQKTSNSSSDTKKECSSFPNFVNIHASFAGVEVIISSGSRDRGLPLSWLLVVLFEEGLSVDSCISTRVNEITFHTIQAEVIILSYQIAVVLSVLSFGLQVSLAPYASSLAGHLSGRF
ncbi:Transcription factor bhlh [Thalictrum thalictroides]|uniref:Transcription factor bhlh n=1 Tax=Thalictrum thalictroides TaxID=46969 RepID=A0A7J6VCL5_THATH|nr:Transcription factor bhlh [Thalictrum thalictroides]